MRVKVIARNPADYTRERSQDIFKVPRNLNPQLHPLEKAREYQRALNATKLERVFAKPFIGALSGHADGVYCLAKHPKQLACIVSGSADGGCNGGCDSAEIRAWNLTTRKCIWNATGHAGFVRGVSLTAEGDGILSVGDDRCVRLWKLDYDMQRWTNPVDNEPSSIYTGKAGFNSVDHHRSNPWFVTASNTVEVWDVNRSEPTQRLTWGADTITAVRFNQTETSVIASAGNDRTITLYDVRSGSPLSRVILEMRTNAIAWNPMEAFNFTAANEDHNCYTFDMRKLDRALNVLKDHVSAVMDVDYSPTGQEIVTGAYDRSIRIYRAADGHSRDIYHTRRMQRVFCVRFSMDSKYLVSGSDDTNLRLWKANAAEKLGTLLPRERAALEYNDALKQRYKNLPEIKRIARHRHVPKAIYSATKIKRTMLEAIARREANERAHSREGEVPFKAERKKHIVTTEQ